MAESPPVKKQKSAIDGDDDATLIRFPVKVSSLLKDSFDSDKVELNGFPLNLYVVKLNDGVSVSLFCEFDGRENDFFFEYSMDVKLVNFNNESRSRKATEEGRIECDGGGEYVRLIDWNTMVKENNGFMKDESILIEARVRMHRHAIRDTTPLDFTAPSDFSDVILVVEGNKLHVSRQILAHQSSYFRTLFYGGFKEAKEDEIELKDLEHGDFLVLLNLMYGIDSQMPDYKESLQKLFSLVLRFDCKKILFDAQQSLIRAHIKLREKFAIAQQFNLAFAMDDFIRNKLDRSDKIDKLMGTSEFKRLPIGVQKEIRRKRDELQTKESADPKFQQKLRDKRMMEAMFGRPDLEMDWI